MITARHEELAALHALGLLEGADRTAFEAELTAEPELRAFAGNLAELTAILALLAPSAAPPPGLKERILASAAAPAPEKMVSFQPLRLLPWAAAAGLAFAVAWLSFQNLSLRRDNEALRTGRELAETAYRMARNQLAERTLLAERMINDLGLRLARQEDLTRLKVTALAALAGDTKEAQAIAVWDPEQQTGLLTVEKMPALATWQDYQIWVVDPARENPVSGGVFTVTPGGRATLAFKPDQPVTQATAFAISREKKGGVPKAEGPVLLLGQ